MRPFNFHSPVFPELWRGKKTAVIRRLAFCLLLPALLMLAACSYVTDFVVINESKDPIELRYKIRYLPGPFGPRIPRAKMTSWELREGDKPWPELDRTQFTLNPEDRTLTVTLMPNEALRIERLQRGGMQVDEAEDAKNFSIEELSIKGMRAEIKLEGEPLRKSFVVESKKSYILTYK